MFIYTIKNCRAISIIDLADKNKKLILVKLIKTFFLFLF